MPDTPPPAPPSAAAEHAHAAFLALLPAVDRAARFRFRRVPCPDRRRDLHAEATALCWVWFVRLAARGKDPALFPAAFARTACRAVACGRRAVGSVRATDVLSCAAGRRRGFAVARLDSAAGAAGTPLADALRDDARTPVPDQVQFRIDFPAWAGRLPATKRRVLGRLAAGWRAADVAAEFGLTAGRVSQIRKELRDGYAAFVTDARR